MYQVLRNFKIEIIALTLGIMAAPGVQAMTVFDPSNFAQNSLTAAHMAESLVNQAQQISNQLRDLEALGYSSEGTLQSSLGELQSLMNSAESLGLTQGTLDSKFSEMYPAYGQQYQGDAAYKQQYQDWNQELRTSINDAMRSHGLAARNVQEAGELQQLVTYSQSAEGNLQAVQAGNQISALILNKLMQLQEIIVAQGQAQSAYLANMSSKEEAQRVMSKHLWSDYEGYTRQPSMHQLPRMR